MATLTDHPSEQLIAGVQHRLAMVGLGRSYVVCSVVAALVFLLLLSFSRLSGMGVHYFSSFWLVAVVPLLGLIGALVWYHRPDRQTAARYIDRVGRHQDLFLTRSMLDQSPGRYAPIVAAQADRVAADVSAPQVVGWHWWPGAGYLFLACVIPAIALWLVPVFDPLGIQHRHWVQQRQVEQLAQIRKAVAMRAVEIDRRQIPAHRPEVEQAIEQLRQEITRLKPGAKQANRSVLRNRQQQLDALSRQITSEHLPPKVNQQNGPTRHMPVHGGQVGQYQEQLSNGESEALKRDLDAVGRLAQQAAELKADDKARREALGKIRQSLEAMRQASATQVGGRELTEALDHAIEQAKLGTIPGLEDQAVKDLKRTLDLAQLETEELAKLARDLQQLQQAMEAAQMAQAANELDKLSEQAQEQCRNAQNLEQMTQALQNACRQMNAATQPGGVGSMAGAQPGGQGDGTSLSVGLSQGGQGGQDGQGGQGGHGNGGLPPGEDNSARTGFKHQQLIGRMQPGQILMEWKSRGQGPKGEVKTEYRQLLEQVRHEASRAILTEQIPPGYHDGIRRYFDSMEQDNE